jgi:hypothetical protein
VSAPKRPDTRFKPGNAFGRRHGLYGRVSEALVAERQDFLRRSLADDGSDVPVRRAARHDYRARVHVAIVALSDSIELHGLFDKRGKLRIHWLLRLEGLISTAQRLDAGLGDDRQARNVTPSTARQWSEQFGSLSRE